MKKRILIVHTWGVGDWLFFKPTLDQISASYPDYQIDLILGSPGSRSAVGFTPQIQNVSVFNVRRLPLGLIALAITSLPIYYEALVFTAGLSSVKADWASVFFRARRKIALKTSQTKPRFLTGWVDYDPQIHMVENNLRLLTLLDLEMPSKKFPSVKIGVQPPQGRSILIHPGCDRANAYRRWPASRFASLARLLIENGRDVQVVLGPDEEDLERDFVGLKASRNFRLYKQIPMTEVQQLIAACETFVNSDSGLGHVAAALGKRVITIMGPGDSRTTRPYAPSAVLIEPEIDLACRPCVGPGGQHGCKPRPCLNTILPERVLSHILVESV